MFREGEGGGGVNNRTNPHAHLGAKETGERKTAERKSENGWAGVGKSGKGGRGRSGISFDLGFWARGFFHRIIFKGLLLVQKSLNGLAPSCITELIRYEKMSIKCLLRVSRALSI